MGSFTGSIVHSPDICERKLWEYFEPDYGKKMRRINNEIEWPNKTLFIGQSINRILLGRFERRIQGPGHRAHDGN
jgi:hypothetical protein